MALSGALSLVLHACLLIFFGGVLGTVGDRPPGGGLVVELPKVAECQPESVDRVARQVLPEAGGDSRSAPVPPLHAGEVTDTSDGKAAIPMLSDERYRASRDLDVQPQPYFVPSLDSVEMVGTTDYQRVEIKLWISDAGIVDSAEVLSGSPIFSAAVHKAFLGARFLPGKFDGKAVPSVVTFEVEYPEVR